MSNAGQALSAVAGAAVGFIIGGPTGALYGFQIGLLAGNIISPTQLPTQFGPRLTDFTDMPAEPGTAIPMGWGTFAVPGFRLYAGPVNETESTEDGGRKQPDTVSYSYRQTLALGLCEGPILGVSRVWENGKLVYDARKQQDGESDDDYAARVETASAYAETFELYLGDEDQVADPTIELEQGAGNVPAYRGLAYMVFANRLMTEEQGFHHPVFKVEIASSPVALGAVTLSAAWNDAEGQVELSWTEPVTGAFTVDNYQIYRRQDGGDWEPLEAQSADAPRAYNDTTPDRASHSYDYKVVPIIEAPMYIGPDSNIVSFPVLVIGSGDAKVFLRNHSLSVAHNRSNNVLIIHRAIRATGHNPGRLCFHVPITSGLVIDSMEVDGVELSDGVSSPPVYTGDFPANQEVTNDAGLRFGSRCTDEYSRDPASPPGSTYDSWFEVVSGDQPTSGTDTWVAMSSAHEVIFNLTDLVAQHAGPWSGVLRMKIRDGSNVVVADQTISWEFTST